MAKSLEKTSYEFQSIGGGDIRIINGLHGESEGVFHSLVSGIESEIANLDQELETHPDKRGSLGIVLRGKMTPGTSDVYRTSFEASYANDPQLPDGGKWQIGGGATAQVRHASGKASVDFGFLGEAVQRWISATKKNPDGIYIAGVVESDEITPREYNLNFKVRPRGQITYEQAERARDQPEGRI